MAAEFSLLQKDPLVNDWALMFWGHDTGWLVRERMASASGALAFVYEACGKWGASVFCEKNSTKDEAINWLIHKFQKTAMLRHPEYIWRRLFNEVGTVAYHISRSTKVEYGSW